MTRLFWSFFDVSVFFLIFCQEPRKDFVLKIIALIIALSHSLIYFPF